MTRNIKSLPAGNKEARQIVYPELTKNKLQMQVAFKALPAPDTDFTSISEVEDEVSKMLKEWYLKNQKRLYRRIVRLITKEFEKEGLYD